MLQWGIILIDEDNRLFSGLLKHRFDDVLEADGKGSLRTYLNFILLFELDKDDPKVWVEFFGHGRYHHVYNCREKPDVMRKACIACANATKDLSYARDVTYPAKTDKLDFW